MGHSNADIARKCFVTVLIDGYPCNMEVDMGSICTIIAWKKLKELSPKLEKKDFKPQNLILNNFHENCISVLGKVSVKVTFSDFSRPLQLTFVDGECPTQLGIKWFKSLGLGMTGIHAVQNYDFAKLLTEFEDILTEA